MLIFGINYPKGVYPFKHLLRNVVWGRESQVRTLTPNFTTDFKNVDFRPKIAKNCNVWYKFSSKGVCPLIRFVQNFAWGREYQDYTSAPNLTIVALKMWPYGHQNRQKW